MRDLSGVELPDGPPHPVSSLRLGGNPPQHSRRAAAHPAGHCQSREQVSNVATRVSHRQVQLVLLARINHPIFKFREKTIPRCANHTTAKYREHVAVALATGDGAKVRES